MSKEREIHSHPSYGMIGFSRVSCSGKVKFFGSDLPVENYIELTIQGAEIDRDLTWDRCHADHQNIIAKVRMTPNQWAEMLMSGNINDGVPCTIVEMCNRTVEEEQYFENRKEYTHRMFKQRMQEVAKTMVEKQQTIRELSKKKTLSADDQRTLNITMDWLTQEMTSNIPFFMQCFQETMDKVVLEAKTEVENAIQSKAMHYGLQILSGEAQILKIEKPNE